MFKLECFVTNDTWVFFFCAVNRTVQFQRMFLCECFLAFRAWIVFFFSVCSKMQFSIIFSGEGFMTNFTSFVLFCFLFGLQVWAWSFKTLLPINCGSFHYLMLPGQGVEDESQDATNTEKKPLTLGDGRLIPWMADFSCGFFSAVGQPGKKKEKSCWLC